jgi:phosphonoacetate hydrolase
LRAGAVYCAHVLRDRALDVLCDPSLAHCVDLVAYRDGHDIVVANSTGRSRLVDGGWEVLVGRDPVANQDPLAFTPLSAELADPSPPNERNSYPFAGARLTSLFADPRAPDLAVVHTGRHYWPDRNGHLGEHGSLGVVQSRAPLLLSGPGVTGRGVLPRAARVVDVAPTLAVLAGADLPAGLDGEALTDLVEPGGARLVVGLLWDGANSNNLLALAQSGQLPAVARLLSDGCALLGGAIAEFPSVTLVNHTCALTGVGPGRHGIVNNFFYDRALHRRIQANMSAGWHVTAELLRPGVRTVFDLVDGRTACVNEPVDRGADYSTFELVRSSGTPDGAAGMTHLLPDPHTDPHVTHNHLGNRDYAWSTQVDGIGLTQMLDLLTDPLPRLVWWNCTLPDSGHHAGGPHSQIAHDSLRDTDRRLGAVLDVLDSRGLLADTAFLLTADHGSEGADPTCIGDWDDALHEAGVPFRDEAYGFLYLGEDVTE